MTRVIAGSARGRKLLTPEGQGTRPTTDRNREALFGMLQFDIPGAKFLDLFAGSGAIGIEALSRGAASLDLVEAESSALRCIRTNLKSLSFEEKSKVWAMDVEKALLQLKEAGRRFDFIFMDPPYLKGWEEKIANIISEYGLLESDGVLIIESSSETKVQARGLTLIKEKTYKTTRFSFWKEERSKS